MTVKDLNAEIINYLAGNPQAAVDVAKVLASRTIEITFLDVLHAIGEMKRAGWLIETGGKLYLQDPGGAA